MNRDAKGNLVDAVSQLLEHEVLPDADLNRDLNLIEKLGECVIRIGRQHLGGGAGWVFQGEALVTFALTAYTQAAKAELERRAQEDPL